MKILHGQIWKRKTEGNTFYIEIISVSENRALIKYSEKLNKEPLIAHAQKGGTFETSHQYILEDFTPLTKLDYTLV